MKFMLDPYSLDQSLYSVNKAIKPQHPQFNLLLFTLKIKALKKQNKKKHQINPSILIKKKKAL